MKPIIHPTAIIGPNVTIEDDVFIGPYCVIGTHAEYRSKVNERTDEPGRVFIGRGTTIREFVTVHGSAIGKTTHIGPGCYIQAHAHIGHDAYLDGYNTIACHAIVAGHVTMWMHSGLGLAAVTHQGARIERHIHWGVGILQGRIRPVQNLRRRPSQAYRTKRSTSEGAT
jgi:UDP-N-acetylglucosamine acyltransferase